MLYLVKQLRLTFIVAGVIAFGLAAAKAFGLIEFGDEGGFALAGFACWLASTA